MKGSNFLVVKIARESFQIFLAPAFEISTADVEISISLVQKGRVIEKRYTILKRQENSVTVD